MRMEDRSYISYSSPTLDESFTSSYEESATILDGYAYVLTNWFLKGVIQGPILPNEVIEEFDLENIDLFIEVVIQNWWTIVTYNWGVLICMIIGVIMVILMPIIGIVWCVFRCRGRGGAKGVVEEEARSWSKSLKTQTVMAFFVLFWALSLFAVIWHFQANIVMGDGALQSPDRIDDIIQDSRRYLNNTAIQMDHWKDVNYEELYVGFEASIAEMQVAVGAVLVGFVYSKFPIDLTAKVEISSLAEQMVREYPDQKPELVLTLSNFRQTDDLGDTFERFKTQLDPIVTDPSICGGEHISEVCEALKKSSDAWALNLTSVPQESVLDMTFNAKEKEGIQQQIAKMNGIVLAIEVFNASFIEDNAEPIIEVLKLVGDNFKTQVGQISDIIHQLVFEDPNVSDVIHDIIDRWFVLAFYCFMIPGYILVIVIFLYGVGFCLGICGSRKPGPNCIGSGSGFFYGFSWIMWILTLALFISGATIQKLGCDTFEDPQNSELFQMFDREFDKLVHEALNDSQFDSVSWSVEKMLEQCEDRESIYTILNLDKIYDVDELENWKEYVDVQGALDQITGLLDSEQSRLGDLFHYPPPEDDTIVAPLNSTAEKWLGLETSFFSPVAILTLENLAGSQILEGMRDNLNELLGYLEDSQAELIAEAFNQTLTSLDSYRLVFQAAQESIAAYEETTQYSFQSIGAKILDMLKKMEEAVEKVKNEKSIKKELEMDFQDTTDLITGFGLFSSLYVKDDIGQCGPAYNTYESALKYTCRDIVEPLNSVWSGIGLTLICFLPLLALTTHLEAFFRRRKASQTRASLVKSVSLEST